LTVPLILTYSPFTIIRLYRRRSVYTLVKPTAKESRLWPCMMGCIVIYQMGHNFFNEPALFIYMKEPEVFTAVTMKNAVFWDVAPYRSCVNRRFGRMYRLHLQGRNIRLRGTSVSHLLTRSPRRHILEYGILQELCRLKQNVLQTLVRPDYTTSNFKRPVILIFTSVLSNIIFIHSKIIGEECN
jgi:hypothetical protein